MCPCFCRDRASAPPPAGLQQGTCNTISLAPSDASHHAYLRYRHASGVGSTSRKGRGARAVRGRRFSWDTLSVIDWNATACGCNKCFFPASQLSERKEEGWLVGKPNCETGLVDRGVFPKGFGCNTSAATTPSWFPQHNRIWTFAEELRTRFGVGHMLSRPPQITTLTPAQAACSLNFNLKRRVGRLNRPHWATPWNRSIPWSDRHSTKAPKQYYSPGPHPVQAVRSCPWPSCVMLGCTSLKAKLSLHQWRHTLLRTRTKQDQAEPGDKAEL